MKIITRQFFALIAASNFDRKQVEEIFSDIFQDSPKKIAMEVDKARKRILGGGEDGFFEATQQPSQALVDKITDSLIREAGLTKSDSYRVFREYLKRSFPDRYVAEPSPKAGFFSWVNNLRKEFSDGELLHVVARIRNERVHNVAVKDDWLHREE